MKVGSMVYATDQGLGILAKTFIDNGIVTHPYIVRHAHHQTHEDWYPGAPITNSLKGDHAKILEFARGMDVMMFFETPFVWELLPFCKQHAVKTVLLPMYECSPRKMPAVPDLYLCPSELDYDYFPETPWQKSILMPVPVGVPWKQRTRAEVFVHNAGHGGLKGRNGTRELFEAMQYLNSDAKFIVRFQSRLELSRRVEHRITTFNGNYPYSELYKAGDVFIFPERHNGLSLPLQEARAAGMLVMGSDRYPMNQWLPREPLIPVSSYITQCISPRCVEFQSAIIDPQAIAATIDAWYGKDITEYSLAGKRWAEANSWAALGPRYKLVLEMLVAS